MAAGENREHFLGECCCRVRIPCSPTQPWSSCSPWRQPPALVPRFPAAGASRGWSIRSTVRDCRGLRSRSSIRFHSAATSRHCGSSESHAVAPPVGPERFAERSRHSTNHRQSSACGPVTPCDALLHEFVRVANATFPGRHQQSGQQESSSRQERGSVECSAESVVTAGSRVARGGRPPVASARYRGAPRQRASTGGLPRDRTRGVPAPLPIQAIHATGVSGRRPWRTVRSSRRARSPGTAPHRRLGVVRRVAEPQGPRRHQTAGERGLVRRKERVVLGRVRPSLRADPVRHRT